MSFPLETLALLFVAGIAAGGISAVAGGSALISFPILIASGLPPINANATNFVTVLPANVGALLAYRNEISNHRQIAWKLGTIALVGGIAGCLALLYTSNDMFTKMVPWLILCATLLMLFGRQLNAAITRRLKQKGSPSLSIGAGLWGYVLILIFSVYGGFFGAGLGVIMLAGMTILGFSDYHDANALKNLTNSMIGLLGVAIYAVSDLISWPHALSLMAGSMIGGNVAIRLSKFLPQVWLSRFVVAFGFCLSAYYFWKA